MRVTLVCKKDYGEATAGKEYPFYFDTTYAQEGCDGYIIEDDGCEHWLLLPSNNHRCPEIPWKSAEYFTEIVHDPEN